MDYLSGGFLKLRPDTVEAVRQDVNLDKPGEMKEAVRILDEWVKQQAHFRNKDFPLRYLESTIISCKGSVERAKLALDKLCTMRTLMPEHFKPFDVKKGFEMLKGTEFQLILPKLTVDHYLVFVMKFTTFSASSLNFFYRCSYVLTDYIKIHGYQRGVNVIMDVSEADLMEAITNVNFNDFKTCYQISTDSFKTRINRVDAITPSKVADKLVAIVKQFIKKKTGDRIVVHKTYEELHKYYPKEILPKEYGGEEKTLRELQDEYLDEISTEEHKEFMKNMYETRTDESLRSKYKFNEMYAGTVGTFRALSVD